MTKYYLLDKDGTRLTDYLGNYLPAVSKEEAEEYAVRQGYEEGEGKIYMSVRAFNKIQGYEERIK